MAAISEVQVGNMALSHIGARSDIESLTEESVEATAVNLWYEASRLETMEAHDWSFARKRVALALHADDAPAGVWAFRYKYPADCIAARHLVNPLGEDADAIPFELETSDDGSEKTILTDLEDAVLVYTFDQKATVLYSWHFITTLSYAIAYHIAYSITGKPKLRTEMFAIHQHMLRVAPARNANERVGKAPREAEHIRARA